MGNHKIMMETFISQFFPLEKILQALYASVWGEQPCWKVYDTLFGFMLAKGSKENPLDPCKYTELLHQ